MYADCFVQPTDANPKPIPARFRCTRADVLRTGGTLVMTARPPSQMTAPGTTSIVIRSTGLTFAELVGVARSLEQVAGSTGDGAGSAQMVGMCRQMVDQGMTFEQASAFAQSNGYTARVGSIDGESAARHCRLPPGPLHRVDGVGRGHVLHVRLAHRAGWASPQDTMSLRSNRSTATAMSTANTTTL